MTIFDPGPAGNAAPNPQSGLAAAAVLNVDIEILTAARNAVEITSVKTTFESAIAILTLVRVGLLFHSISYTHLSVTRSRTRR